MKQSCTLGAIAGTVIAVVILAALSVILLNSDGADYKILVAVWLWLLPVIGVLAGIGYGAGKIIEVFSGAKRSDEEGGLRADA